VYGYNLNYHFPRDFAEKVMGGGYKWNETMREYTNITRMVNGKNKLVSAGEQMTADLGEDRYGITYAGMLYRTPQVKALAVSPAPGKPAITASLQTVQDRSYPLAREVYYYAPRRPGAGLDPLVKEYMRYVLSREGQEAVQRDGKYLPLTSAIVRAQLGKLDEIGKVARGDE
jgi:phosphate transport system substrate-binding protein